MWTETAISVRDAAHLLATARATGRPTVPVRTLLPAGDLDAAYAVQSTWVAERVHAGARVVGRKIGLTNSAVRAQLGVDEPDFGYLLDDMACPGGEPVDSARLLQPRIEAEVAFVLAHDLDAEHVGLAQVAAATAHVVAALEIVDSRVQDWDIDIVDTVADNASAGLFVLGGTRVPLAGLYLPGAVMTMRRGSEVVSTGSPAACLPDPLAAVAWLANKARSLGTPLRAGEIVLSGALGPVVPVAPGDEFHAEITGVGGVSVRFAGGVT